MARVLIVGDPARAGELAGSGHVVEVAEEADPERLATVTPHLASVSVLCWLMGDRPTETLHGDVLESLLEYLVDTPVRGIVYERSEAHPAGAGIVARAERARRMPCAVVSRGDDLAAAVARVLAG